jgi:SAM-dependent methyltransferase
MLKDHQDAMGHMMYDYLTSGNSFEIVERDDGFISVGMGPRAYFTKFADWFSCEKTGIKFARGKVLDIGCGAGRHSLYLQNKGYDVTGIDLSPLAVKVSRMRGLKKVHNISMTALSSRFGIFDTILMLGNNSALLGNFEQGRRLLKRFYKITSDDGIIIAQNRDPYATSLPEHLEYHRRNRKKGKLPGEARIRIRYMNFTTPWKKFLLVSPKEMKKLLEGTGWKIQRVIKDNDGIYVAIIGKIKKPR